MRKHRKRVEPPAPPMTRAERKAVVRARGAEDLRKMGEPEQPEAAPVAAIPPEVPAVPVAEAAPAEPPAAPAPAESADDSHAPLPQGYEWTGQRITPAEFERCAIAARLADDLAAEAQAAMREAQHARERANLIAEVVFTRCGLDPRMVATVPDGRVIRRKDGKPVRGVG